MRVFCGIKGEGGAGEDEVDRGGGLEERAEECIEDVGDDDRGDNSVWLVKNGLDVGR
jgi:hypothetical protein